MPTPGILRNYRLRARDGSYIPLRATNRTAAVDEALDRFGFALEVVEPPAPPPQWSAAENLARLRKQTRAELWQLEALSRIPGVGLGACRALVKMRGRATVEDVLGVARGKARARIWDILKILNAPKPSPAGRSADA